jgi:hypothetical protein
MGEPFKGHSDRDDVAKILKVQRKASVYVSLRHKLKYFCECPWVSAWVSVRAHVSSTLSFTVSFRRTTSTSRSCACVSNCVSHYLRKTKWGKRTREEEKQLETLLQCSAHYQQSQLLLQFVDLSIMAPLHLDAAPVSPPTRGKITLNSSQSLAGLHEPVGVPARAL